jgi:hypothetical protein
MKVFDNYEISPCKRYEEPGTPGKFYFEVCEPKEADVWTLYGHVNAEGVQAIGDFTSRNHAEETFFRITGVKFTGSYKADARLRLMHAGPKLLEVLEEIMDEDEGPIIGDGFRHPAVRKARAVITRATGRTP